MQNITSRLELIINFPLSTSLKSAGKNFDSNTHGELRERQMDFGRKIKKLVSHFEEYIGTRDFSDLWYWTVHFERQRQHSNPVLQMNYILSFILSLSFAMQVWLVFILTFTHSRCFLTLWGLFIFIWGTGTGASDFCKDSNCKIGLLLVSAISTRPSKSTLRISNFCPRRN